VIHETLHFSAVFGHRVAALGYLWAAALYLLLALVLGDWFCLGGAAGCVLTARHSYLRIQDLNQEPRAEQ
jgi:hypothetical protein